MRAVLFIFSSTAAATAATAVEEGGVDDEVDMMTIRTKDVVVGKSSPLRFTRQIQNDEKKRLKDPTPRGGSRQQK